MIPERIRHYQEYHYQPDGPRPLCPPVPLRRRVVGTLSTIGYTEPDAARRVADFMEQPRAGLIDIRFSPRSRWLPAWNKGALRAVYGMRYLHIKNLGNVNYNQPGQPIQLLNPDEAVTQAVYSLRDGYSLLLLCACKDYERCHRKLVFELISAALEASQHVA